METAAPVSQIAAEDLKNIRGGLAVCYAGDPPEDEGPTVRCDANGEEGGGWRPAGPTSRQIPVPYDHSLDR